MWLLPPQIASARRLIVLVSGENPTFDYYLAPRIGSLPHCVVDVAAPPDMRVDLRDGDYVLACRYVPLPWLARLLRARGLAGIGILVDDDFHAFVRDGRLPLPYRASVLIRGLAPLRILAGRLTHVLVSTAVLGDTMAPGVATVLHPAPGSYDLAPGRRPRGGPVRLVFHAQLSHLDDHAFAAAIARRVAARTTDVAVEVIGPSRARRLWADVPRARFRDEMPWSRYRALTREEGAEILMAPLLDTAVNRARAPTKAIDAVRMGAAGVFSDLPPYQGLSEAARLIGPDVEAWAKAITRLARDDAERSDRAARLRDAVGAWARSAGAERQGA